MLQLTRCNLLSLIFWCMIQLRNQRCLFHFHSYISYIINNTFKITHRPHHWRQLDINLDANWYQVSMIWLFSSINIESQQATSTINGNMHPVTSSNGLIFRKQETIGRRKFKQFFGYIWRVGNQTYDQLSRVTNLCRLTTTSLASSIGIAWICWKFKNNNILILLPKYKCNHLLLSLKS